MPHRIEAAVAGSLAVGRSLDRVVDNLVIDRTHLEADTLGRQERGMNSVEGIGCTGRT